MPGETGGIGTTQVEYVTTVPDCEAGYQLTGSLSILDDYASYGATVARVQFSWYLTENYTNGNLAIHATNQAFLDACLANNIKPLALVAYGSPYDINHAFPHVTADVPVGSTVIPVDTTATLDPPHIHLRRGLNPNQITDDPWHSSFGAFVHAVTPTSITIASPTNIFLANGDVMWATRLRYAPIGSTSPTDAGTLAFVRFARFVAQHISDMGFPEAWVEIWNEPIWSDDIWHSRGFYYNPQVPALEGNATGRLWPIMKNLCEGAAIPRVKFVNGAANKSGVSSLLMPTIAGTGEPSLPPPLANASQLPAVWGDAFHPYGNNPEAFAWYDLNDFIPGQGCVNHVALDSNDGGSTFYLVDDKRCSFTATWGVAPKMMVTECGPPWATTQPAAAARYIRRRVASMWADHVSPVIMYAAAGTSGNQYDVVTSGVGAAALPVLMEKIALLGGGGGSAADIPAVASAGTGTFRVIPWDLMKLGIHGRDGAVTLLWQRTRTATVYWYEVARAATIPVTVTPPDGVTIIEVVNLETGADVSFTGPNPTLQVGDDLLLVLSTGGAISPPPTPPPTTTTEEGAEMPSFGFTFS